MRRRHFLSQLSLYMTMTGMMYGCKSSEMTQKTLPKKWLWLRPDIKNTNDDWKRIFEEIKNIGFDAVLPQIYSSDKALFNIGNYEVEEALLERIIPIAHDAGLQVHAWMWTMPCNNKDIIKEHPDWYVVNRKGEPAHLQPAYVNYYKFLCPRNEEVRNFIKERVKALASIEKLDGIHLDYVRMPDVILAEALQPKYNIVQDQEFPQYDYCYCQVCRKGYQEIKGIDPLTISDPAHDSDWYQFRYEAVSEMVNKYLVPEAKKKDKWISAAVFPNWESVRQAWHTFNLDAFLPMLYNGFYNEPPDWVGTETKKGIERLNDSKPVYSGLFLGHLSGDKLKIAVESGIKGGAKGVAVFSYGDWSTELKANLKEALALIE